MNRGSKLATAFVILALPWVLGGCSDYDDCCDDTDVFGTVLLGGLPVSGANVRIIFNGFIEGTQVTGADGTFRFDDWPEGWDPFFVEAFFIDPLTLNEYQGVTPFFFTDPDGDTDVGNIILIQTFPATAGGPNNAIGHLDADGVEDLVVASSDLVAVVLASGEQHVVATATEEDGPFGAIAIEDVDGDGLMDLAVNRLKTGSVDVWFGDGAGGFLKP